MANFSKISVANAPRAELHDLIGLIGAEVSINGLTAGAGVPFFHAHKQNEEICGVPEGSGVAIIDGEKVALKAGDWLRADPKAGRKFPAAANDGIKYVCIHVRAGSLSRHTAVDAVIE